MLMLTLLAYRKLKRRNTERFPTLLYLILSYGPVTSYFYHLEHIAEVQAAKPVNQVLFDKHCYKPA